MMFKQFLVGIKNILTLRVGPQGLPYSPATIISFIIVTLTISYFLSDIHSFIAMVVSLSFTTACVWLGLFYSKKQERFVQTISGMIITGWIITLAVLGFWYLLLLIAAMTGTLNAGDIKNITDIINLQVTKDTLPTAISMVFVFGLLVLVIWKFLVDIFIIRQAFEWKVLPAIALLLVIYILPACMEQAIFGLPVFPTTPTTATAPATAPTPTSSPSSAPPTANPVIQINS